MKKNFKIAKDMLSPELKKKEVIAVNGCVYGRDNNPYKIDKTDQKLNYYKICGQSFWELISGDDRLYKNIIQPLDIEVKKRDDDFKSLYVKKINEMTRDVINLFYTDDNLDWDKIIDYISKEK